jgi:hypothetical protein
VGPIMIFDKSFLQSLSVDESVWFDHFFLSVVTPIFYIETLADLSKPARGSRSPETEVRIIADKFPDMHGTPCMHHADAALSSLYGNPIPMNGTVPLPGGRPVKSGGLTGVVFEQAPESKAFYCWQDGEFLSIERDFAREWRTSLSSAPSDEIRSAMRAIGIGGESSRTLADAKAVADASVCRAKETRKLIELILLFLGASRRAGGAVLARWESSGSPPLPEYAPYAAFMLTVDVFFQVALAASLIARERPSNRVDIAYLYYLPFCMAFVSCDGLHAKCAPLFLRGNQDFVKGDELKSDLRALNKHFLALRAVDGDRDLMSLPHSPPENVGSVVSHIWRKHMRPREDEDHADRVPEDQVKLVDQINQMHGAPTIPPDWLDFDVSNPDALIIERRVRRRKGSWLQIPKDIQ